MMVTIRSSSSELSSPAPEQLASSLRNSTLRQVDICFLCDDVCKTTSNTLDLGESEHDLATTLNVGVKETEDVLKVSDRSGGRRSSSLHLS